MTPAVMFGRTVLMLIAVVAVSHAPLLAHDMWIEPTTFSPEPGHVVGVKLRVGQDLLGDPLRLDPALVNQFVLENASGRTPLVRRDGSDPAGLFNVATPGLQIVGYHSNASRVEIGPDKFTQYLKEEGLDAVVTLRARRPETGANVRELFSRCAKSLVYSGEPGEAQHDRLLGFTLELVAERNPYGLRAGQDLPIRLMYENRPLAGALVVAMNRLNPAQKISARTDKNGRVRFALQPGGMWMVKAVHMIPAPAGSNADWSSYWASLTFEFHNVRGGRL